MNLTEAALESLAKQHLSADMCAIRAATDHARFREVSRIADSAQIKLDGEL
jgi:hypothetical protein